MGQDRNGGRDKPHALGLKAADPHEADLPLAATLPPTKPPPGHRVPVSLDPGLCQCPGQWSVESAEWARPAGLPLVGKEFLPAFSARD